MNPHTSSNTDMRKDIAGMAFGSLGIYLGYAVLMTYFTIFLTDNMLISAASVSVILLASRILDAFSDLWVGSLLDRGRSKMGKARPWLLWMAAPSVISMVLLFYIPPLNETGKTIYAFITYNLVAFFYLTALTLPMNALVSLISPDEKYRLIFSQIWGFCSTLGAVFVNYFSTSIMQALGGGNKGYFWYFTIISFVGVGFVLICFSLTKERVKSSSQQSGNEEKLPFKTGITAVLKNKYWWNAMGIYLMSNLVPACWAATAYYCLYWMGGQVDTGRLMALLWGGITAGILMFIPMARKIGKTKASAIGLAMQAIGSVLLWIAPASIPMLWISTVFRSVGVGGLSGSFRAMLADVVEYGEWKTGIRTEGLVFSGSTFGGKVGSGLGGAIVAALLAWGGYVPNAVTQAARAMLSIKLAFIAVPFAGSIIIIILLLLFRVEKLMPAIRADLEKRNKVKSK